MRAGAGSALVLLAGFALAPTWYAAEQADKKSGKDDECCALAAHKSAVKAASTPSQKSVQAPTAGSNNESFARRIDAGGDERPLVDAAGGNGTTFAPAEGAGNNTSDAGATTEPGTNQPSGQGVHTDAPANIEVASIEGGITNSSGLGVPAPLGGAPVVSSAGVTQNSFQNSPAQNSAAPTTSVAVKQGETARDDGSSSAPSQSNQDQQHGKGSDSSGGNGKPSSAPGDSDKSHHGHPTDPKQPATPVAEVPEPPAIALMAVGGLGLVLVRRRSNKTKTV